MGRLSYLLREAWRGLWYHRSLTFTPFLGWSAPCCAGVFLWCS
jgi:hypothetical protein